MVGGRHEKKFHRDIAMPKEKNDRKDDGKFSKGNSFAIQKGEVRNPKGRPKGVSIHQKLRDLLESEDGDALVDAIAKAGIEHAVNGNPKFWEMIVQIIDGKIPDKLETDTTTTIQFDDEARERIRKIVESADYVNDDTDNRQ